MKVTLLFLCCLLVKGLVAQIEIEKKANQEDCARYVNVTTFGRGYENVGIPSDGSPAIFRLDVDVVLENSVETGFPITSLYRHASGGCIVVQDTLGGPDGGGLVVFQNDCTGRVGDFTMNGAAGSVQDLGDPCFLYSKKWYYKEEDKTLGDGKYNTLDFTTPDAQCSACRVITDGRAGQLEGSYALQDHYNYDCGSDTDMCGYEKDGETYCFKENGMYDIDFSCPAS